jgi:hypothetical protein
MPIIPATQELEEDQSLFKASHAKKKKIVRSCLKKQTKSKGLGHSSSGKALA